MHYICTCGHKEEDHWNEWAECDLCGCMLFEMGRIVDDDPNEDIEVLTFEEDSV